MKFLVIKVFILMLLMMPLITEAQVINAGVGGNNSQNLLNRLQQDVLDQEPDMVILMVGTNDMLNSKKMISYSHFESNLRKIVRAIISSECELVLMSPPPADSVYLFERHDKTLFKESPNVKLDSVRQITSRIAATKHLKFIDLYQACKEMGIPKHNEDLFFKNQKNSRRRDGVHLTVLGYHFIGELVFSFLKENQLLSKKQKIICFGDSITRGGGSKGGAYPTILAERIEAYNAYIDTNKSESH